MRVHLCPRCGAAVISVADMTFDLGAGDIEYMNRTITAQYAIMEDRPVVLSGPALMSARKCGMKLYRRHGSWCPRWWKGRGRQDEYPER